MNREVAQIFDDYYVKDEQPDIRKPDGTEVFGKALYQPGRQITGGKIKTFWAIGLGV